MQVYDQFEIESKGEILGFKCFKKHFDQKLHSEVSKKYRQPKSPSTVPPPRNFSYQFGSSLFHLKKSRRSSGGDGNSTRIFLFERKREIRQWLDSAPSSWVDRRWGRLTWMLFQHES